MTLEKLIIEESNENFYIGFNKLSNKTLRCELENIKLAEAVYAQLEKNVVMSGLQLYRAIKPSFVW